MKLYQVFSLLKWMPGMATTAVLIALLATNAAIAADYTTTITGPATLQGGDTVIPPANNYALYAHGSSPNNDIQVLNGGISATSVNEVTVSATGGARIDLGTGSSLQASGVHSFLTGLGVVRSGGMPDQPAGPHQTMITGEDLSLGMTSDSNNKMVYGINAGVRGGVALTGNTRIKTYTGFRGHGLYVDERGVLSVENAELEMDGYPSTAKVPQFGVYATTYGTVAATKGISVTASGSTVYGIYVGSNDTEVNLSNFTATLTGTSSTYGAFMYRGTILLPGSSDVNVSSGTNAYGLYVYDRSTVSVGTQGSANPNNSTWNVVGGSYAAAIRVDLYSATWAGLHDIKVHNATLTSSHDGIYVRGSRAHVIFDNSTLLVDPALGDLADVAAKTVGDIYYDGDLLIDARNASQLSGVVAVDTTSRLGIVLASNAQWTVTGSTAVTDLTQNNGRLIFSPPAASVFKTLTVLSDYETDNGSTIVMNTTLDNGANPATTDLLVIEGDATGTAALDIRNVSGTGALTTGDGIQVVQINGSSDAVFTLTQPVIVGTYEYELVKVGSHWYLQSSQRNPPTPTATSIPTLNSSGLVLLIGLLGMVMFIARRRFP
ncbi:MAG: hypothetical protein LBI35_00925 [Burkholderiales bacterium]|jgi:hypothetical protein|nr:hypothetical protein [Burkholderiales bacterium]